MSIKEITTAEWFANEIEKIKNDLEYIMEGHIIEFGEQIVTQMEELKMSRRDLAKKIGVSPAYISKILNGNPNMSLKTMIKIAQALESDFYFGIKPKWKEAVSFDLSQVTKLKYTKNRFNKSYSFNQSDKQFSKNSKDINVEVKDGCSIA